MNDLAYNRSQNRKSYHKHRESRLKKYCEYDRTVKEKLGVCYV